MKNEFVCYGFDELDANSINFEKDDNVIYICQKAYALGNKEEKELVYNQILLRLKCLLPNYRHCYKPSDLDEQFAYNDLTGFKCTIQIYNSLKIYYFKDVHMNAYNFPPTYNQVPAKGSMDDVLVSIREIINSYEF